MPQPTKIHALPTPSVSIGGEWLDEYALSLTGHVAPSSAAVYLRSVRQFLDWLDVEHPGVTDVAGVTRHHVDGWLASLAEAGRSPATRSVRLKALSRFFDYVLADEDSAVNPCTKVARPRVEVPLVEVPTDAAVRALLKACDGRGPLDRRDAALVRLLADAGLRREEAVSLDLDDVDLTARAVMVRKGKGGRARVVAIGDKTALAISRWQRTRRTWRPTEDPALFLGSRGGRLTGDGVFRILERRCETAGLEPIHPHQLRHHATHALLAAGVPDQAVEVQMGWTGGQMVRRYASALAAQRALDLIGSAKVGDRL